MDTNAGVVGQAAVDNILAHFGVKGQKWGVRSDAKAAKTEAKKDQKWEVNAHKTKVLYQIHNAAAAKANQDIQKIDKKYTDSDLRDPRKQAQYDKEVFASYNKRLQEASDAYGTSPSGKIKLQVSVDPATGVYGMRTSEVTS